MGIITTMRNIDKYIGNLIIFSLSIFKCKNQVNNIKGKNILVIRLWTLGESLLTLPMIKRLKKDDYNISILITNRCKGVFEIIDFIDEVVGLVNFWEVFK